MKHSITESSFPAGVSKCPFKASFGNRDYRTGAVQNLTGLDELLFQNDAGVASETAGEKVQERVRPKILNIHDYGNITRIGVFDCSIRDLDDRKCTDDRIWRRLVLHPLSDPLAEYSVLIIAP